MPRVLEAKLKKEYGANSSIPYKIMNKMGIMKARTMKSKPSVSEKRRILTSQGGAKVRESVRKVLSKRLSKHGLSMSYSK